ncbi:MAG: sulfite exporter TauE/SafE family protein, partial [Pyrinomonadaceae bacterium]
NSLITVPVMFQFGIPEKEAVATNMFGLVFMSIGATIPFVRRGAINFRASTPLIALTVVSSALGAALVGYITDQSIKLIVSVAMIVVVLFTLMRNSGGQNIVDAGDLECESRSASQTTRFYLAIAYVCTFLLGIYGGLYSGGYVTILTAVFVAFLGMGFGEAVAATKFVNVFSSSVATMVFMWQGLVNYRLGAILAVTMFVGAYAGAHYASRMNDVWLKRIFLATVSILAIKTLYDFV